MLAGFMAEAVPRKVTHVEQLCKAAGKLLRSCKIIWKGHFPAALSKPNFR
jgi:hypothetical protein